MKYTQKIGPSAFGMALKAQSLKERWGTSRWPRREKLMIAILRFVVLPATVISGTTWFLILRRRSTLLPFLAGMGDVMLVFGLSGFPPSSFFVSFGGYALFASTSLLVAGVARVIDTAIRQMRPDWKLIKQFRSTQ